MKPIILAAATALLAACAPVLDNGSAANTANTASAGAVKTPPPLALPPVEAPTPGTPGALPDDRTPLAEGPIDAKSPQGAAQVVQQAAAFGEEGKYAEMLPLMSPAFRERLGGEAGLKRRRADYGDLHAQVGGPSAAEGAAGSLYVTVPVVLYGRTADTKAFSRKGEVRLRRVNDVPGATPEQLRWHIDDVTFEAPIAR